MARHPSQINFKTPVRWIPREEYKVYFDSLSPDDRSNSPQGDSPNSEDIQPRDFCKLILGEYRIFHRELPRPANRNSTHRSTHGQTAVHQMIDCQLTACSRRFGGPARTQTGNQGIMRAKLVMRRKWAGRGQSGLQLDYTRFSFWAG